VHARPTPDRDQERQPQDAGEAFALAALEGVDPADGCQGSQRQQVGGDQDAADMATTRPIPARGLYGRACARPACGAARRVIGSHRGLAQDTFGMRFTS
jgi:hypothetical protein